MDTARPGDVITLKDGEWKDAKITINKGGTVGKPVVIKAESPGGVILGGSSSLKINAPYVTVEGLFFSRAQSRKVPSSILIPTMESSAIQQSLITTLLHSSRNTTVCSSKETTTYWTIVT